MPLPSFTVTGNLFDIPGVISGGELETRALAARLVFTPNIDSNALVSWDGDLHRVRPIGSTVGADGAIVPVLLLANDEDLSVEGVQWRCDIYMPRGGKLSFWFDAEEDGETVDLAVVARVPGVLAHATDPVTQSQMDTAIDTATMWPNITEKPTVIAAGATAEDALIALSATATGRSLLWSADAAAGRTTLGALPKLADAGAYTYDAHGNATAAPDGSTYAWESDGDGGYRVHTQTVGGVTRTFTYGVDGTIASVA